MASFEKKLPLEQWQQILANVSHSDLCNVMLTSRHMNSVASWPHMWAGMKINMEKVRKEGLAPLYAINRFKNVGKYMSFDGMRLTTEELERVLTDIPASPVENVNFEWNRLTGVSPELLASAVQSLISVNLSITSLTLDQSIKLLEASLNSKTLAHLNLCGTVPYKLCYVSPDLLASAVQRLTSVNLTRTRLTLEQVNKLLEASLNSTTLDHLDLREQCNKAREASLSSVRLADLVSYGVFDERINSRGKN